MSHPSLPLKSLSATLAIWAERLLLSFQWLVLWIALFIAFLLFDVSGVYLTGVFWIGFLALLVIGLRRFQAPTAAEIAARLEQEARLSHRPIRGRDDKPSARLSAQAKHFWQQEITRKESQLGLLKWVLPVFRLTQRDPFAIRIGLLLLLITGLIISGGAAPDKIRMGLFPFISSFSRDQTSDLKIVITPPGYTRLPQLVISGRPKEPVSVAAGSTIRALVRSSLGHLMLHIGESSLPLKQDGKTDAFSAVGKIEETASLSITQLGFPRLSVPVAFIKDKAPILTLRGEPEVTTGGQLQLPLTIQDDYGLKLVRVRAQLDSGVSPIPLGSPVFEEQSVIVSSNDKPVEINPKFDLTGHPWAGYPVSLLIEVEDHAGQSAQADPIAFELPERPFRNKVAASIAATRKTLIQRGERVIGPVSLQLVEILSRPGLYNWDSVVTLTLRSSLSRLGYTPTRGSAEEVIVTLWPTALKLEDGNLTSSQADLRKALENLQKAIQDKKSPEEIAQLMQEFKQALMQHLMATQKEMQKQAAQGEMMMLDPAMMTQTLDPSMLEDFLNQLENEMINGDIESAMKKLENLQKLSDMLDPSLAQPVPEDMKETMKNMQDLQKLIDAQQALLDRTRSKKDKESGAEEKQQGEISKNLDGVKESANKQGGKPSENIGKAGTAMDQSQEKLGHDDPQGSVPHQQQALDELRQGKKEMQQQLQQRMQKMMGLSIGQASQNPDPLGRNQPGNGRNLLNENVKIPTGSERKKSDEILKTIRERSGDLSRPQAEREYYQRLLRQW